MSKELKPWEKIERLEMSVMQDAPAEVAVVCRQLGKVEFTARALGLACRYRGLETVKVLVERGASFKPPGSAARTERGSGQDFSLMLIDDFPVGIMFAFNDSEREITPTSERLKIAEYLLNNAERVGLFPERLLYFSIYWECGWLCGLLKKHGASLPKDVKIRCVQQLDLDKRSIGSFRLMEMEIELDYFKKYTKRKMKLLRYIIDNDASDLLAAFEPLGWFKQPDKLRELISYAADNKKPQCAARLLEYSHRGPKCF